MTRPDFYKGIHPQLDCDIVAQREGEYMARLEAALQRILDMPRKMRTGKLCRQIAKDALTQGDEE